MLTTQSVGGKPEFGTEKTGAATDKISSKLAQAKTGSQRRYVKLSFLLYMHRSMLLILPTVPITDSQTGGEEGRAKEMNQKHNLYLRVGHLARQRPLSNPFLYIDVQSSSATRTLSGYARVRPYHVMNHSLLVSQSSHCTFLSPTLASAMINSSLAHIQAVA